MKCFIVHFGHISKPYLSLTDAPKELVGEYKHRWYSSVDAWMFFVHRYLSGRKLHSSQQKDRSSGYTWLLGLRRGNPSEYCWKIRDLERRVLSELDQVLLLVILELGDPSSGR
jgi:hypothetical protein